MSELQIYPPPEKAIKFLVVGLIASTHFQKCRFLVEKLHKSYPKQYEKPEIRQMLNVDWQEYIIKMRRRFGKPFYLLHEPVAVFIDGEFIGNDKALTNYIMKSYFFEINFDFIEVANQELIKYLSSIMENKKRSFVYFTIAIDEHIVGSLLFVLYDDLVPNTCKNFIKRCTGPKSDYKMKPIHRIVKNSWIQCGGWNLKHRPQPCENYVIPHNRRGVLSMCNAYKHADNSTQFFITLEATPWMNYKYVAFGQCVQGAEILSQIEKIPTYYQKPLHKVVITDSGIFSLCPDEMDTAEEVLQKQADKIFNLNRFYESLDDNDKDGVDSIIKLNEYQMGKYCLKSDMRSYFPFMRFSRMFNILHDDAVDDDNADEYTIQQEENKDDDHLRTDEDLSKLRLKQLSKHYGLYCIGTHVII